jgi:hypothetical protein
MRSARANNAKNIARRRHSGRHLANKHNRRTMPAT